jgi:hypothetical protein
LIDGPSWNISVSGRLRLLKKMVSSGCDHLESARSAAAGEFHADISGWVASRSYPNSPKGFLKIGK